MSGERASISTRGVFVPRRFRGTRVPNPFSIPDELTAGDLVEEVTFTVRNARLLEPPPTLETHGFQLIVAPTACDLNDPEQVAGPFYEECQALVARLAGTNLVLSGMHEYRTGFLGAEGERGVRQTANGSLGAYAEIVHCDSSPQVEDRFDFKRHVEMFTVWRSTKNETIRCMPLALCDVRSVDPADIVFGDGVDTSDSECLRQGVNQRLVYSPSQRWYFFPDMTPDEVLVFRQYDTRQAKLNLRAVFHTAVRDPDTPDDVPLRSTIDVKVMAFHGEETERAERIQRYQDEVARVYFSGAPCTWWNDPVRFPAHDGHVRWGVITTAIRQKALLRTYASGGSMAQAPSGLAGRVLHACARLGLPPLAVRLADLPGFARQLRWEEGFEAEDPWPWIDAQRSRWELWDDRLGAHRLRSEPDFPLVRSLGAYFDAMTRRLGSVLMPGRVEVSDRGIPPEILIFEPRDGRALEPPVLYRPPLRVGLAHVPADCPCVTLAVPLTRTVGGLRACVFSAAHDLPPERLRWRARSFVLHDEKAVLAIDGRRWWSPVDRGGSEPFALLIAHAERVGTDWNIHG